jgi:protein-L-isoaspartate O-methyltransferase
MAADRPSGTEGYADEAEALVRQYESLAFADVHRQVLHLIPTDPCRVLDIGAGTGRDAAGFAALGHRVTAVEPTAELRTRAEALHPSARIEWLDDNLPDLARLSARRDLRRRDAHRGLDASRRSAAPALRCHGSPGWCATAGS